MVFVQHFIRPLSLFLLLDCQAIGDEKYGEDVSCQWLLGPGPLCVTVVIALANRQTRPYQILSQSVPKQRNQGEK